MRKVRGIVHRLVVDLDDDIPGSESALIPATAFFHRAHQHALAVLDPKEFSQLRGNVLDHQSAPQRRVDDDHRNRYVEVGQRGHLRHPGHDVDLRLPFHRLVPVGELHLDRQWLAVTADAEIDHAARRRLLNHPTQLSSTLYRRAVQAYDHVMFVQTGLSGGSVLVDHRDLRSVLFLELQFSEPLRRDVCDVHSEIRGSTAPLFRPITPTPAFARAVVGQLRRLRAGNQRKKKHAKQEAMDHNPPPEKANPLMERRASPPGSGRARRPSLHNPTYRLTRRKSTFPEFVRTFSTGPPPFSCPSAVTVFGPSCPPSLETRMSEKSLRIVWPLPISISARMEIARSFAR